MSHMDQSNSAEGQPNHGSDVPAPNMVESSTAVEVPVSPNSSTSRIPTGNPERSSGDIPVTMDEKSSASGRNALATEPWQTTFWRYGPISGLLCLFLAFASIFGCLGILVASNKEEEDNWAVQPTVYLAILTAVANQSMRYAALQGVAIAWWYGALQGTTLAKLHHDWDFGHSIWSSLIAGRKMNILALACIASTLVAIDGPLVQRASRIVSVPYDDVAVHLVANIAPQIPRGYTGNALVFKGQDPDFPDSTDTSLRVSYSKQWAPAFYEYAHERPMKDFITGCPSRCSATVRAPAFNYSKAQPTIEDSFSIGDVAASPEGIAFYVYIDQWNINGGEQLDVHNMRITSKDCKNATMSMIDHVLYPAIAEYEVVIDHGVVTFAKPPAELPIVAVANNTFTVDPESVAANTTIRSTIGGIQHAAHMQWSVDDRTYAWLTDSMSLTFSTRWYDNKYMPQVLDSNSCGPWGDPRDEIMAGLNELMFRTGIKAATEPSSALMENAYDPDVNIRQELTGKLLGDHNVFQTDFWYFAGAAILEIVCILLVLPTYWGWWRLGRAVSFSPLEVAKAFEAPLFQNCNSNSAGEGIAKAVGAQKVKYGATGNAVTKDGITEYEAEKLAFVDEVRAYRPLDSFRFRH